MSPPTTLLVGFPGPWEVWVILIVILLLFGRRIPQVARSLGQGISQFKKGLADTDLPDDEPEDLGKERPRATERTAEREKELGPARREEV